MTSRKSREQKNNDMGDFGERVVIEYLKLTGNSVIRSSNKYDSIKDFTRNQFYCELKTQVPWVKESCFSVRLNQMKKLNNADEVYFLAVPNKQYPQWYDGCLFKWEKTKGQIPYRFKKAQGRDMALIPIKCLEQICKFNERIRQKLQEDSISYWN